MSVVGLWPAKLIVCDDWAGTDGSWTARKILQEPSPAIVTHHDVKLTVRTKTQNAAVMVSSKCLISVGLIGAQFDQVAIERQRRSVPHVPVNPIRKRLKYVREIC